ncbi:MAG: hypothetical protein WC495_04205 [Patescibacteria group bacterium]|jgi:hypothetical protein
MQDHPRIFRPSKALIPFAVFFLLLVVLITGRIIALGYIVNSILILPFALFAVWWFGSLLLYAVQFRVAVSEHGLECNRPAGGLFDTESTLVTWDELKSVEFVVKQEFNPKAFTGREAVLRLKTKKGNDITIPNIMIIDHYPDLFSVIQERLPFVYELPEEQLWDTKTRMAIVGVVAFVFIVLLFIFI